MAVRRHTSAVASLTSDSPSSIVTTRRGRPIRRAMAVAATASGGATTAPRANAAANGTGSSHQVSRPTPTRGEDDQPDRQEPDRPAVRPEVDQRGADRRGVQQRRQQADQHHFGGQVAPRGRTAGTRPPTPTSVSSSGADRSNRRASPATAVTVARRARAVMATGTREVSQPRGPGRAPGAASAEDGGPQRVEPDAAEVERRRWNALRSNASPSRARRLVAGLQPDPLADLVRRRLPRPAEVAVELEAQERARPCWQCAAQELPGLVGVHARRRRRVGRGLEARRCMPMSTTTRAARSAGRRACPAGRPGRRGSRARPSAARRTAPSPRRGRRPSTSSRLPAVEQLARGRRSGATCR